MLYYKKVVAIVFTLQFLRQVIMSLLPFLCFLSLNVQDAGMVINFNSFYTLFCSSNYVNLISSFLAFGAPEISYQVVYTSQLISLGVNQTIASSITTASNIVWRVLTFFLNLIIGGIMYMSYKGVAKREELLYSGATIYDLEVLNLHENNSYSNYLDDDLEAKFLSREEVEKSFERIKAYMSTNSNLPVTPKETCSDLASQKKELAKAILETEAILKKKSLDPEIESDRKADLARMRLKDLKKSEKKKKRLEKKNMRAKKALEKMQPNGTTITLDNDKGLDIKGPEVLEGKTFTTSDPDEENKR